MGPANQKGRHHTGGLTRAALTAADPLRRQSPDRDDDPVGFVGRS